SGSARAEAEGLAAELAAFPKTSMRAEDASGYEQWKLSFDVEMAKEFQDGMAKIKNGEIHDGAQRFKGGEGQRGRDE
ncbi:crotonase/enoyl-CoA hydratase family protein, partial [Pseudomonas aeruginosa]